MTERYGTIEKADERLQVFISYSREDLDFAMEIVAGLNFDGGFDVAIDLEAIHAGELWKARLVDLISSCDAVVFILSRASVNSQYCVWEVEEAARSAKKIVVALASPLAGEKPPDQLSALNYVRFDGDRSFMAGLVELRKALSTDIKWIREHTRLLVRAREWIASGRTSSRLLSGNDIAEAKAWLQQRPSGGLEPASLHFEFIRASEAAAERTKAEQDAHLAEMVAVQQERARALEVAEAASQRQMEAIEAQKREQSRRARAQHYLMMALSGIAVLVFATMGATLWQMRETQKREVRVFSTLMADATSFDKQLFDRALRYAVHASPSSSWVPWSLGWEDPDMAALETSMAGIALMSRQQLSLNDHPSEVTALALSTDARLLATGAGDVAVLWDLQTGEKTADLKGHRGRLASVQFSPDGNVLATTSLDATARLWDARSGKLIHALGGHEQTVVGASFSADGARLMTVSWDHSARVWDTRTGSELAHLKGHSATVWHGTLSPDGQRAITASFDKTARLWDLRNNRQIAVLEHGGQVWSARFDPEGRRVVTASGDKSVRVWDADTGKELGRMRHDDRVRTAEFSPDATRIVSASSDRTARIWDADSGKLVRQLEGHAGEVVGAQFTSGGAAVLTWSIDGSLRLWNPTTGFESARIMTGRQVWVGASSWDGRRVVAAVGEAARVWQIEHDEIATVLRWYDGPISALALNRNGRVLATAGYDKSIRLVDVATGRQIGSTISLDDRPTSLAFSPDGTLLASAANDGVTKLWRTSDGGAGRVLEGDGAGIRTLAFLNDSLLAAGDEQGGVTLWSLEPGREPVRLFVGAAIRKLAASPDGRKLLISAESSRLHLFDVFSEEQSSFDGPGSWLSGPAFSPDGKLVTAGSDGGDVVIWDRDSGRTVARMVGHRDWVVATAISPDSKLVASGALDGTVRLWEAGSGREIARLEGHSGWVESVAFTPDGKRVVTGSRDGTVRLWEIGLLRSKRGAELRQWICDTKLRGAQEFTDDELAAPILKGISGDRRNPCRRRSSLDWWLGR